MVMYYIILTVFHERTISRIRKFSPLASYNRGNYLLLLMIINSSFKTRFFLFIYVDLGLKFSVVIYIFVMQNNKYTFPCT